MKRLVRTAIVGLFVAYALLSVLAAASQLWTQRATIGLTAGYGGQVRTVTPGGPAALLGILVGDRIDLASAPFAERRYIAGVGAPIPVGASAHFSLVHAGVSRPVTLKASLYEIDDTERTTLLVVCAASLVFIAVGAALVLLRPSDATWGFGLYCLLVLPAADYPYRFESAQTALTAICSYDIVQNLGPVGLLVFALDFPHRLQSFWRKRLRRCLAPLFVVMAGMTVYPDVANLVFGRGAMVENQVLQIAFGAIDALATGILWRTYRRIKQDDRERMRWVLIGFVIGLAANYIGNTILFSSLLPIESPHWVLDILASLNVLLPLTVAHAVVRHRVLDINFVVGRALVVGSLTVILALLFSLFDWLFGHFLEEYRLSMFINAGISIAIAFAFDALHKRAEHFIEGVFFHKRRSAEKRLANLAAELPQARRPELVDDALVGEAVAALELSSAALFRLTEGERFVRTAAIGWNAGDCTWLDDNDRLLLALRSKNSVELRTLPWRRPDVPGGPRTPLFAVRIHAGAELAGVALYGGHPGGGDLDSAELGQLERLATAAGIALDTLDDERAQAEITAQTVTIRELQARLDELRRAAPPSAQLDPL